MDLFTQGERERDVEYVCIYNPILPVSVWITNSLIFTVTLVLIHVSQSFSWESKARPWEQQRKFEKVSQARLKLKSK